MKNNREKIGTVDIDWQSFAFGVGKNRRKTVGFGQFNKKLKEFEEEGKIVQNVKYLVYIRELSIIDGGIGCALWDASIILSRWIRENSSFFQDKLVCELGAG
jgi:hypothetical protein